MNDENKRKTVAKINGHDFVLKGDVPEEYMLKLALIVDKKISEITKQNKKLSTAMIYILTAINFADDLENNLMEKEKLEKKIAGLIDKIKQLEKENISLKKDLEESHNELDEFINTFDNKTSKVIKFK